MKNKFGKMTTPEKPYAVYKWKDFEYKILKTFQMAKNESNNPNAKWESVCKSPFTHGSWERGYLWVDDFFNTDPKPKLVECRKEWEEVYCNKD